MNRETTNKLLDDVRQQDYPLELSVEDAESMCDCIHRIMEMVPADDQIFVRGDYDLVTSALCHPTGSASRTNERC